VYDTLDIVSNISYILPMSSNPASSARLGVLAGASAVTAILANATLRHSDLPQAARLVVALLPVPFFFMFILAELHWIQGQDEFHRLVMLKSLAIAFPCAIAIGVTVEALQKAGLLVGLSIGDVWPLMALTWIPSIWLAARSYR